VFADQYKAVPTLGFTHFQPALAHNRGQTRDALDKRSADGFRRAGLQDSQSQALRLKRHHRNAASFMELFNGDHQKIRRMEEQISREMALKMASSRFRQTYSRKADAAIVLDALRHRTEPWQILQRTCACFPISRNWKSRLRADR
jgi:adenylosuccinate lyase